MSKILIVTHRRGFESDPVIDQLRERGMEVFRFNCDSGDAQSQVSFRAEEMRIQLECDNYSISSDEVAVGWCQQLPPHLNQPANEFDCLQNQNLSALQLGVFDLLETPWLNRPSDSLRASNKVLQIAAAQAIGLTVPKTLFSNQPDEIREFARDRIIVAKNLATPWIVSRKETQAAYTRIVSSEWLSNNENLSFCPVIYQEYHRRKKDYRVVVIGNRTFTAFCEPKEHQQEDVRHGVDAGESYRSSFFDKGTLAKLQFLMKNLSLDYCAADFIEDENGNLYFLEVNTCGSWWWLDSLYGGGICNAITDFLVLSSQS